MRFLIDYHHSDLFESWYLLLEPLGIEIWRPIGMEWFHEGIWQFEKEWHGDAVAKQYLDVWDTDSQLLSTPGVWGRDDSTHPGRTIQMIDYSTALDMEWDAVISSLPANDEGMKGFADRVGAKFAVHIGNEAQHSNWGLADFGFVSSKIRYSPGVPHVVYHQPFDLETFRHEWPPAEPKSIASFIQCFAENKVPYAEFLDLARSMPDYDWKVYGAYGSHEEDEYACGNLSPTSEVAARMRDTRVIWHSKAWSDGYGHVIHNAFSVGRPVIGNQQYYLGKLAEPLWEHGVTSFDVTRMSQTDISKTLARLIGDDDYHRTISENAAKRFHEVVDFDSERDEVAAMLEAVL